MWNEWVGHGVAVIAGLDGVSGRSQALASLFTAARRPMPLP
jgi:hypothetical protein